MSTIERVLTHFEGVRRNGAQWMALCPGHADKNPSLSINERDGKILIHCHAGCDPTAVLAAKGLTFADLNGAAASGNGDGEVSPKIKEIYPYTDEDGSLLFEVVRYEPKA